MGKNKQISIFVLGLAFITAFIPVAAYAQTVTDEPATDTTANTEMCNLAKQRISFHAGSISTVQADHSAKYATMQKRIDTLLASATKAEYAGVAKLTTARDSVKTALSAYDAQTKVYATALKDAQAASCGEDTTAFDAAVESARAELVILRNAALAVKASIKENTVPALREYASWLKSDASQGNS